MSLVYHPAKTPQCELGVMELAMEKFLLVSSKKNTTVQIPAHLENLKVLDKQYVLQHIWETRYFCVYVVGS